ncbi:MAG: hypothetical protein JXR07_14690 [Reichenbachiella sp.]
MKRFVLHRVEPNTANVIVSLTQMDVGRRMAIIEIAGKLISPGTSHTMTRSSGHYKL